VSEELHAKLDFIMGRLGTMEGIITTIEQSLAKRDYHTISFEKKIEFYTLLVNCHRDSLNSVSQIMRQIPKQFDPNETMLLRLFKQLDIEQQVTLLERLEEIV